MAQHRTAGQDDVGSEQRRRDHREERLRRNAARPAQQAAGEDEFRRERPGGVRPTPTVPRDGGTTRPRCPSWSETRRGCRPLAGFMTIAGDLTYRGAINKVRRELGQSWLRLVWDELPILAARSATFVPPSADWTQGRHPRQSVEEASPAPSRMGRPHRHSPARERPFDGLGVSRMALPRCSAIVHHCGAEDQGARGGRPVRPRT